MPQTLNNRTQRSCRTVARGSFTLQTRCPNPMSLFLPLKPCVDRCLGLGRGADLPQHHDHFLVGAAVQGPFKAPIEDATTVYGSAKVEAVTMPAKVEAFMVCSACGIKQSSNTSLQSGWGTFSVSM